MPLKEEISRGLFDEIMYLGVWNCGSPLWITLPFLLKTIVFIEQGHCIRRDRRLRSRFRSVANVCVEPSRP